MKKILYGVCGIGGGHTHRQLPLIEHFSRMCRVVIFAYGYSYDFYTKYFKDNNAVSIILVAVPFYVGGEHGIDFDATKNHPRNQSVDFDEINEHAKKEAYEIIGVPDLVISDYEPISARYAYEHNASFITIDQQSKYLCGNFPIELEKYSYQDEIERLHLFFPKADTRIVCSFFKVLIRSECADTIEIYPPILKNDIVNMVRAPLTQKNILVYVSTAREFNQTAEDILRVCATQKDIQFHLFLGEKEFSGVEKKSIGLNIALYPQGDPRFSQVLTECSGIVSTAGHSLLSEAMYLGIPVYAIPVGPYEQHMNAYVVDTYKFGISWPVLDADKLHYFIENIEKFSEAIKLDTDILMRGVGQKKIISFIENKFL